MIKYTLLSLDTKDDKLCLKHVGNTWVIVDNSAKDRWYRCNYAILWDQSCKQENWRERYHIAAEIRNKLFIERVEWSAGIRFTRIRKEWMNEFRQCDATWVYIKNQMKCVRWISCGRSLNDSSRRMCWTTFLPDLFPLLVIIFMVWAVEAFLF